MSFSRLPERLENSGDVKVDASLEAMAAHWPPHLWLLNTMHYLQTPLQRLHASSSAQINSLGSATESGGLIHHDFLILQMMHEDRTIFLRAEKVGDRQDAGIRITRVHSATQSTTTTVCIIDLGGCRVCLEDVLKILKDHNPNYSIYHRNCWEYATRTATRLLDRVCRDLKPGCSRRVELEKEKERIKPCVIKNHVEREGFYAAIPVLSLAVFAPIVGLLGAKIVDRIRKSRSKVEESEQEIKK